MAIVRDIQDKYRFMKKQTLITIFISTFLLLGHSIIGQNNKNLLLKYDISSCDGSSDPYSLVNRITEFRIVKDTLHLSINFSGNCCPVFNPYVNFKKNKLYVYSNDTSSMGCSCNCCFTINYDIANITQNDIEVYFENKRVFLSQDPYPIVPIKFELNNNDTINRNNKYGAKVGKWITFDDSKKIKSITYYEETNQNRSIEIRKTKYYPSGLIERYITKDTTEEYYDNGKLKSANYNFKENEDFMEKDIEYYENGKLKLIQTTNHFNENKYRVDSISGQILQYSIGKAYYVNGQLSGQVNGDTTIQWFETGQILLKSTKDTLTEYYINGKIKKTYKRYFKEYVNGEKYYLNNEITKNYFENGTLSELTLVRDEAQTDGIYPFQSYQWNWNNNGELINRPNNWFAPIPK